MHTQRVSDFSETFQKRIALSRFRGRGRSQRTTSICGLQIPSTLRKGGRSSQLDPPNRTAVVELAFQFDERGSIAIKDPYLHVRWLPASQMPQQSSDPSDFHSHSIMHCFQFNRAMGEWFPAFWNDHKFDQPRARCGSNEGYGRFRYVRLNVFHQRQQQAVGNICRQVKPLVYLLFFAVIIREAHRALAGRYIDQCPLPADEG